jgi:hypothetical protein
MFLVNYVYQGPGFEGGDIVIFFNDCQFQNEMNLWKEHVVCKKKVEKF